MSQHDIKYIQKYIISVVWVSIDRKEKKIAMEEGGGTIHIKEQESMVAVRGELNAKQTHKANL